MSGPLRIVLNGRADDAAGRILTQDLPRRLAERGVETAVNDWESYERYDVAVFLGYEDGPERAREVNPAIRTGLFDPKLSRADWLKAASRADFLIAGSVEQRDAFYRVNRNITVYYMVPEIRAVEKEHRDKSPIVIGYHGNRVHLEAMAGRARPAIEALARRRDLEFWAMYNFSRHGRATLGMPDVRVRHIAWSPDAFHEELAHADIGLVPTELPVRDTAAALEATAFPEPQLAYEPFDYLVRFKVSANPGRLFPFAQLGIPVVADFTPSMSQLVLDGVSGFLASSAEGWLEALEALADSAELRERMAGELRLRTAAAQGRQLDELIDICRRPLKPPPELLGGTPSGDSLARLERYPQPRPPALLRLRNRARRLLTPAR